MHTERLEDRLQPGTHPTRHPGSAVHADAAIVRKIRWWIPLVVLCGLALGAVVVYRGVLHAGGSSSTAKPAGPAASRTVPVVAAAARRGDMPIYLNGLGTVTAFNTVTIHSRVDGQLMKVLFEEGQTVNVGDKLAEIDKRPFEAQLMQAQGQLAKDEATLKNANLDLARYQTIDQRAITQEQRDTAEATVAQLEGTVKSDQAQIDAAKLQLVYCDITSPISGRIGLRTVDQGNMVHANDAGGLAVITQLQPIAVVFSLPQDSLPQILKGMNTGQELTALVYSRDLTTLLATGKLLAVDNQVDPGTGTVRFKARFENEDNALFPNQFVNVRLQVDIKEDAVIIPAAAVQRAPQTSFVYVVKPDETVEMRPITLGPTEGDETSVEDAANSPDGAGIASGEIVVIDGVDKLVPGTKVRVGESGLQRGAKPERQKVGSAP